MGADGSHVSYWEKLIYSGRNSSQDAAEKEREESKGEERRGREREVN